MDHLLLKQLIVQVNYDLKDLLQINLFSLNAFGEREMTLNGRPLSKTEQRHFYASSLARSILDNPPVDYTLTARQYAAANLLYYWGNILRPPELQPNHKNLLHTSIKNYIAHLEINEAKLFNSLLQIDIEEQQKEKHLDNNNHKSGEFNILLDLSKQQTAIPSTPRGIDKRKVMSAFQGIKWDYDHWGKNLASPSNELKDCRVARGNKNTSALWNPIAIGLYLLDKGESLKKLDVAFFNLKDWSDEWREKTELERD